MTGSAARGFTTRFVRPDRPEFEEAARIRYEVLHAPFGVPPSDDWNDGEPNSEHLVALDENGRVIGYARLVNDGPDAQIRQVAVEPSYQRRGAGRLLVATLIAHALERHASCIWLNARVSVIGFYEAMGFVVTSDEFLTGRTSLPHRRMEYSRCHPGA